MHKRKSTPPTEYFHSEKKEEKRKERRQQRHQRERTLHVQRERGIDVEGKKRKQDEPR